MLCQAVGVSIKYHEKNPDFHGEFCQWNPERGRPEGRRCGSDFALQGSDGKTYKLSNSEATSCGDRLDPKAFTGG